MCNYKTANPDRLYDIIHSKILEKPEDVNFIVQLYDSMLFNARRKLNTIIRVYGENELINMLKKEGILTKI